MSKINQIQQAILSLGGGAYQKLMDAYLLKRYKFENIMPLGSHVGTDKTTKGVPDSFVRCENEKFILISHGTVGNHSFDKVKADILACLKTEKTGIGVEDIEQIICCHTSTNFTPGQIKELCSLFSNVVLIGLAEVSYDLLYKYQLIALDHLGIDIDTHQIFDVDDFIVEAAKNAYSTTLDMPLLCRETELDQLVQYLEQTQIVLVFGASGIGKTRLAIEAARQYSQRNDAIIKVIKSNNESIYEDLKATFGEENEYIVIVDDANQLAQLDLLLSMAVAPSRKGRMKLLLTVRDYAKEKLLHKVREVCLPVEYQLSKLSDESIERILSENLGITNQTLRKQIQIIAKGNARLAVMAGVCALQGNLIQVHNAFDIFNDYYSAIIEGMEHKELFVASLVALFESFTLEQSELPLQLAIEHGISEGEFIEHCYSLHKKEVISLYEKSAVRFENQNLRDYLIYYMFFRAKMLAPSDVIISAFPCYRNQVVFAFNTLIQLFNTEENIEYIESEIRKAWRTMRDCSAETVEKFVESFLAVIPNESLLYIKQEIDKLPYVQENLACFDFKATSHQHIIHSKLIEMLARFKHTDQFKEAIQLAIYFFERNNEYPMDFYFLFKEKWGYSHTSYRNNYESEKILVNKVLENFQQKKTLASAQCLYFVVSNCLGFAFSTTEPASNNSISFIRFSLPACEEIYELRKKCIYALSELLKITEHSKYAYVILKDSFGHAAEGPDQDILERDLAALEEYIAPLLTAENFDHCILLNHIEEVCEESNKPYPSSFEKCSSNQVYSVYLALKTNYHFKFKDYDLGEQERKKELERICEQVPASCFLDLWAELHRLIKHGKTIAWEVTTGIEVVFELLQNKPDKFIVCAEGYMRQDTPGCIGSSSIVDNMVKLYGVIETEKIVSAIKFKMRPQWLARIYDHVLADEVTEELECKLLSLKTMPSDERYPISFETAIRVNEVRPGFIVAYLKMLNEVSQGQPWFMTRFLRPLTGESKPFISEFVASFAGHMDVLYQAYRYAIRGEEVFDYKGNLFERLIAEDLSFIDCVVEELLNNRSRSMHNDLLDVLWKQDAYLECITVAFEALRKYSPSSYSAKHLAAHLLSENNKNDEANKQRREWIEAYIAENSMDRDSMRFLFDIICDCPYDQFLSAVLCFCRCNPDYSDFCEIPLSPSSFSWSGSEVPLIEKQITFLTELSEALKGFQFIEHRARLSECIQWKQEYKQRVLMKEFLEKDE